MKQNSMSKRLIDTTIIYFIANFSTRILSFLLLPLYTSHLSPADYGSVDMVFTLAQFLTPVITLNLTNAAFRFLVDVESFEEREKIISSAFFTIAGIALVFLVICTAIAIISKDIILFLGGIYIVTTCINSFMMQMYRGIKRNKTYAAMGVAHSFLQIMLNVLFVVGLQIKSLALLLSPILSCGVCVLILMLLGGFYRHINIKAVSRSQLKPLLRFSLPTVPETLIWWFLTGFAKMYLSTTHGEATLGIYAVASKFSDLLVAIYSIFNLAWAEMAYASYKEKNRDEIYSLAYNNLTKVMLCCIMVLLPLTRLCISWFLNESYLSGVVYMPVLYVMAYINILSTYYGSGFQSAKKTNGILISSLIGVAVNVPLCLILIPCFDVWGTVIALFAANIALLISKKIMARRFFTIAVDYNFLFLVIPVAVCIVAFYTANPVFNIICLIMAVVLSVATNWKLVKTILHYFFRRRG